MLTQGVLPLVGALRFPHEVLAVGEVAAYLPANHHAQLIDGQLRGCAIVAPVVIVRAADRIELIWVLVLDDVLPDAVLDL